MKTTGASKSLTSQNQTATAERGAEKVGRSVQNAGSTPSSMIPKVVANGSGQTEITPMHGIKDRDEPHGETAASLLESLNNRGTSMLADPRIVKNEDGTTPINFKITLSCEECMYETNDLP